MYVAGAALMPSEKFCIHVSAAASGVGMKGGGMSLILTRDPGTL